MQNFNKLPEFMKNDSVKKYYIRLKKHEKELVLKRLFDITLSILLLLFLAPVMVMIGTLIKLDSKGPVLFRQVRVTMNGRRFRICKFRTMVKDADKQGTQVTAGGDSRITKTGRILRKYRLDELPQLFNVLAGEMSFVGTRPEVEKYVRYYTDEMKATLLLPAGITSLASVTYKDEENLLRNVDNVDDVYIHEILPEKMKYNLKMIENYSFLSDVKVMVHTVLAVFLR